MDRRQVKKKFNTVISVIFFARVINFKIKQLLVLSEKKRSLEI